MPNPKSARRTCCDLAALCSIVTSHDFVRGNAISEAGTIKDLTIDEVIAACGDATPIALRPGEVLFREGDDATAMYVVKHGTLRVLSGSTILETVRDGGLIGEMAIIEEHMPRSATVIAGTYCELLEIDIPRFLSLVANAPSFSLTVLRVISRRLRVMNRRYRDSTHHL